VKASKGTILVVDDSATIRNLIKKVLEADGFRIIQATNGIEALTRAMSDPPPDLITLDIDMPKMDGFDACRKILSDYHQKEPIHQGKKRKHIVFVTANDTVENRRKGFESGAADFIAKPFSNQDLRDTIRRILSPDERFTGMTALVVDDSHLARNIIVENISREGLSTIEADNGRKAFDIVSENKEAIDIIITDLVMPEMDGIALCRDIRKVLHLDQIPIIFLTSMADQQQLLKVFHAGATDYLIKPFFREELLARLRVHLEKSLLIKKMRQTIAELNTAERERTEKQKLQGVVEMAGTVCHELNQPIQTISGLAELTMMKADEKNPLINYIKKIKHQADRMGKITGQLMNVTAYRTKPHDTLTHIIDINKAVGNQT